MLDVIITSTCRDTIKRTLDSFLHKICFSGPIRFIVNIDVLQRSKLRGLKDYFFQIKRRHGVIKIELLINESPDGSRYKAHSLALNNLYRSISSKFYFHLEDDWLFLNHIDLDKLIHLMDTCETINHIRLSKTRIKDKCWIYYLSDEVIEQYLIPVSECVIDNVPLVKTFAWSFNPHVGRSSIVKKFISLDSNDNPEKRVCNIYHEMFSNNGLYILGHIGDSPTIKDLGRNRIKHTLRKIFYVLQGGKYVEYKFA